MGQLTSLMTPSKHPGMRTSYQVDMNDSGEAIQAYGGDYKDVELARSIYIDYSTNAKRASDMAKPPKAAPRELDADAEEFWATQALLTGKLPALGMGGADTRIKLLNKATKIASGMGMSPVEMRTDISELGGLDKAIAKNQRRLTSMGSFVRDVELTADRVVDIAERLKTTDARLLNWPLRVVQQKVSGDAELSAYLMNIMDVAASMSKITSGAEDSVAQLPEGARQAWEGVMDPDLPLGEILKLIPQVKKSAFDRLRSVEEQHKKDLGKQRGIHDKYNKRFGGFTQEQPSPTPTKAPPVDFSDEDLDKALEAAGGDIDAALRLLEEGGLE
jgi:hypothetical protein